MPDESPILEELDQRLPLYARLADVLTRRIASGEWSPDAPLPAETALATDYGVSVGTLRKAMGQLVDEGLLERRQGSGTFVRRARLHKALVLSSASRAGGPQAPFRRAASCVARSSRPSAGRRRPGVSAAR